MRHVDRQKLAARLVDIFDPGNPSAPQDDVGRLQAVHDAIDQAVAHAIDSETRQITILLSDLRGFTAMAEGCAPMDMVTALNRYLERMTEIILRHGGSIDKFIGDGIMVLFGAPKALDKPIKAALACAIEMQLAMDDINAQNHDLHMSPLYMGIGINTGDVVVGHLGSPLYTEYTVIGDEVNLTSRLEAHSLRGQILLSESTYELAKDFIEVGEMNEVHVKGKKGSVRMVELLALHGSTTLTAPRREVRASPRVAVDMPLAFQVLDGTSVIPRRHTGRIVDMGYGGMFVLSPVPLLPFDDIKMALSLSLLGGELTDIYAKVLHVTEVQGGTYKCPVEFTSIDSKAQQAIKEFVDGIVEINTA
jgi:adenylate cyclase